MSPKPSTKAVRDFVSSLPDDYLECRQFGHNWKPFTVEKGRDTFKVRVICDRCETFVIHTISRRTGDVVKKPYRSYPKDYLAPHGFGRLDGSARSVIRLENVERLLVSLPEHEESA